MKTAVVLFNLGGPDSPQAVRGFLRNLFGDPAILRLPWPIRPLLAAFIAKRRAPTAAEIYREIGGRSPILPETEKQAAALTEALDDADMRVFVAMRYWHPMSAATAQAVKDWGAEQVFLLPLYPQFSTTTTQSSHDDWMRAARRVGLVLPTRSICCYPAEAGFVAAYADLIKNALPTPGETPVRVLFSAHGLPERIVEAGDPYVWQVHQGAAAIAAAAGLDRDSWRVSFQSRVGPLKWVGPATDDEIKAAGREGIGLVVVPIAFVSEHSETLVELDIEYRKLADEAGVTTYIRVPAVGTHSAFIEGLREIVAGMATRSDPRMCTHGGGRICPAGHGGCPAKNGNAA
jgi:ferrochelatase